MIKSSSRRVWICCNRPSIYQLVFLSSHTSHLETSRIILSAHQLAPNFIASLLSAIPLQFYNFTFKNNLRTWTIQPQASTLWSLRQKSYMSRHHGPRKGYFESSIELTSSCGAYPFVCIHLDQPILHQITKILILV